MLVSVAGVSLVEILSPMTILLFERIPYELPF